MDKLILLRREDALQVARFDWLRFTHAGSLWCTAVVPENHLPLIPVPYRVLVDLVDKETQ